MCSYLKWKRKQKQNEAAIQVLALTKELGGIAILDDSVARQVAKIYRIESHGTLYLPLRLYYEEKITKEQAKKAIDDMIAIGLRLTAEEYSKILKELK